MHARLESHLIDKLLETFSIATMYSSDGGQMSARGHQVNAGVPSVRPVSGIPEAGEQKNSQRTLPFLPGKQIFRRSSRHLAEERLPKINNYITELLKLPEHISQCERVLRFFRSNWQEDRIRCDEGHGALSRENSTTSVKYTVKQLSNSRLPLNYSSSTEELLEGIEEHPSSSASSKRIFAING